MRLYYVTTQAPRRVCALAKHLGIDAEFVNLGFRGGLKSPAYLALNPNGKAPTLVDGDKVVWEATAISVRLCAHAGSDMWPARDPDEQVEVLRWISWNAFHWAGAVGASYFEFIVKPMVGIGAPDPDAAAAMDSEVRTQARVLDRHLQGRDWVALDRLTIADFALGAMIADWELRGLPFDGFPALRAWNDRLLGTPAWLSPWPEQATAWDDLPMAKTVS